MLMSRRICTREVLCSRFPAHAGRSFPVRAGRRYLQYKVNTPSFVGTNPLAQKYGVLVYESKWLTSGLGSAVRSTCIAAFMLTPVVVAACYIDIVLTSEADCDLKNFTKYSVLSVICAYYAVFLTKYRSRNWMKRLFYHRKTKSIYIETFKGMIKPQIYGPYPPSIAFRRLTNVQNKAGYATREHLVVSIAPDKATPPSKEDLEAISADPGETAHQFGLRKANLSAGRGAGSELGSRKFVIEEGPDLREKKLFRAIFKLIDETQETPGTKDTFN